MNKYFLLTLLALVLAPAATAQCPANGTSGCSLDYGATPQGDQVTLQGYDITFQRPNTLPVNTKLTLAITVTKNGQPATGLDIQGQIIDPETTNELFFGEVTEPTPGTYQMTWKPGFAGDYYLQYIFRANNTAVKPLFALPINDPRATYAFYALLALAIISAIIGIYASLTKKPKKNITWKPLLYGLGLAIILVFLGYSVKVFYESGGERGFVICGKEGCDIAIHWHSQLYMTVCGDDYHLPLEAGDLDRVHTHKERDYLHFHSLVKTDRTGENLLEPEKLYIGDVFDQLDIPFTSTCFADYCNGDTCPDGSTGELSMTVNGIPNQEFDEYTYQDGDEIHITFG